MHLREKGGKERDALVLPDYADRVRKIFAKYSAKPSNSKYLLPLTALPKDMPLHYLQSTVRSKTCTAILRNGVQQRGTCTIAERNAKGKPTIKVSYWRYPSRWGTAAAMWWYLTIYIRRYLP